jgi:hypothetical protein
MSENVKHAVDVASAVTAVGTLTAWLPPIAALLSVIWTAMRITEMVTGKTIAELIRGKAP